MGKIIVVTAGVSNTGVTTTVAAVSSCLATLGYRVLCFGFGTGPADLNAALCMPALDPVNIAGLIDKRFTVTAASREHPDVPNLFFLPLSASGHAEYPDIDDILQIFVEARENFDFCIIDTAAGANIGTRLAHIDADTSLLITTEDLASLTAAKRMADLILNIGVSDLQLILNRIKSKSFSLNRISVDDLVEDIGAKLTGFILEDKYIARSLRKGIPIVHFEKKRSVCDYRDAARRLTGEDVLWRTHFNQPYPPSVTAKKRLKLLVGTYGDPNQWASSTMTDGDPAKLVNIYEVKKSAYINAESVRYRMWLHDVLDDNNIPYHIEVRGYWVTRKKYAEAQCLFVQKEHKEEALRLIMEYKDTNSIADAAEDADEDEFEFDDEDHEEIVITDGISQVKCQSCGEMVDFDYHRCPFCKALLYDQTEQV